MQLVRYRSPKGVNCKLKIPVDAIWAPVTSLWSSPFHTPSSYWVEKKVKFQGTAENIPQTVLDVRVKNQILRNCREHSSNCPGRLSEKSNSKKLQRTFLKLSCKFEWKIKFPGTAENIPQTVLEVWVKNQIPRNCREHSSNCPVSSSEKSNSKELQRTFLQLSWKFEWKIKF